MQIAKPCAVETRLASQRRVLCLSASSCRHMPSLAQRLNHDARMAAGETGPAAVQLSSTAGESATPIGCGARLVPCMHCTPKVPWAAAHVIRMLSTKCMHTYTPWVCTYAHMKHNHLAAPAKVHFTSRYGQAENPTLLALVCTPQPWHLYSQCTFPMPMPMQHDRRSQTLLHQ